MIFQRVIPLPDRDPCVAEFVAADGKDDNEADHEKGDGTAEKRLYEKHKSASPVKDGYPIIRNYTTQGVIFQVPHGGFFRK